MRKFLAVMAFLALFLAGFSASFAGSYTVFRSPETPVDATYLMKFTDDDDTYFLQKAPKDIVFYINTSQQDFASLFTLTDGDGNELSPRIKKSGKVSFRILPPANGYEAGEEYRLELHGDAVFAGEYLAGVRQLVFVIEQEEGFTYAYQADTRIIHETDFARLDGETVDLKGLDVAVGDIVVDETGADAFKIVEMLGDGLARVEAPALDEIFSELDVYGEIPWRVDDIEWNRDLELEIAENVRNSAFFRSLIQVAYADDHPKGEVGVKVKTVPDTKTNTVKTEIKIKLVPGEKGLFGMSKLQNQEVSLTLQSVLGFTIFSNIDGPVWDPSMDISVTTTNDYVWSVQLEAVGGSALDKELNVTETIKNMAEYQSVVNELTEKLASVAKDREDGEIRLFKWSMPFPSMPFLRFEADVLLFAELELAAELILSGGSTTRNTAGILFKDYKFRPYTDEYRSKSPVSLSIMGKAELEAGIKLELKAVVFSDKVAFVQIDPQAGVYSEVFVTYPVNRPETMAEAGSILGLYGYFEGGLYFRASFKAQVNLILKRLTYEHQLIEKRWPLLDLGNDEIAIGLDSSRETVRALNNSFTAPDILFKYYDVTKGTVETKSVPIEDIRFTSDGEQLQNNLRDVLLPPSSGSSMFVNASYRHPGDNRTYSALFRVIMSGSEIEGRVSAYTSGSDYEPITNATVKLYAANELQNMLGTARTDDTGRFAFNVSEGRYVLKISAPGYKELTSIQSIGKDETKFTEHILLVDDSQRGTGTAGGRVTNAIDGNVMSGVTLRLRENWNNYSGPLVDGFQTVTDSAGQYRIEGLPSGYYTVEAMREGFLTGYANLIVHETDPRHNQNFAISPVLPEDQIRIVLRWGEHPRDLDSHLIGIKPDGSSFNVYYANKEFRWNGERLVDLDVDDTTSYGPETITIYSPLHEDWVYAVHDYTNLSSSNSDKMSYSEAYVTVFMGGTQVASFHIPVGRVGTYWTVFEFVDGQVRPVNEMGNIKPSVHGGERE